MHGAAILLWDLHTAHPIGEPLMLRLLSLAALAWTASLLISPALAAAELAPLGSEWTGAAQRFGPPDKDGRRITSDSAYMRITERDGESFTAELESGGKKRKVIIAGKIHRNGGLQATVAEHVKGDLPNDIIGRTKIIGTVKDDSIKLRVTIPQGGRFGEIVLKRKAEKEERAKRD
jgi:hypothetical protein